MKNIIRYSFFIFPITFFAGLWWGYHKLNLKETIVQVVPDKEIQMLTLKGFFPKALVQKFEAEHNVKIDLKEVTNEIELFNEIKEHFGKYDVIHLLSTMVNSLNEAEQFLPLDMSSIPNLNNISSDFLNAFYNNEQTLYAPISWEVEGVAYPNKASGSGKVQGASLSPERFFYFLMSNNVPLEEYISSDDSIGLKEKLKQEFNGLNFYVNSDEINIPKVANPFLITEVEYELLFKEQLPSQFHFSDKKSLVWTHLLGINKASKHPKSSQLWVNYLLTNGSSVQLVQHNRHATTLHSLDNTATLPSFFKSNRIRELAFNKIETLAQAQVYNQFLIDFIKQNYLSNYQTSEKN